MSTIAQSVVTEEHKRRRNSTIVSNNKPSCTFCSKMTMHIVTHRDRLSGKSCVYSFCDACLEVFKNVLRSWSHFFNHIYKKSVAIKTGGNWRISILQRLKDLASKNHETKRNIHECCPRCKKISHDGIQQEVCGEPVRWHRCRTELPLINRDEES